MQYVYNFAVQQKTYTHNLVYKTTLIHLFKEGGVGGDEHFCQEF